MVAAGEAMCSGKSEESGQEANTELPEKGGISLDKGCGYRVENNGHSYKLLQPLPLTRE